jgi:hypothetical protein
MEGEAVTRLLRPGVGLLFLVGLAVMGFQVAIRHHAKPKPPSIGLNGKMIPCEFIKADRVAECTKAINSAFQDAKVGGVITFPSGWVVETNNAMNAPPHDYIAQKPRKHPKPSVDASKQMVFMTPAQARAAGMGEAETIAPYNYIPSKRNRKRKHFVTSSIPTLTANVSVDFMQSDVSTLFIENHPGPTVEIIYHDSTGVSGFIRIKDKDGKLLLEVSNDGTVKMADGRTPDEAAQAFWKAMVTAFPKTCENVKQ